MDFKKYEELGRMIQDTTSNDFIGISLKSCYGRRKPDLHIHFKKFKKIVLDHRPKLLYYSFSSQNIHWEIELDNLWFTGLSASEDFTRLTREFESIGIKLERRK